MGSGAVLKCHDGELLRLHGVITQENAFHSEQFYMLTLKLESHFRFFKNLIRSKII